MMGSCPLVCGVCEGLFHCKRLVELMHGSITVTSEVNRGTTMSFTMRGKRLSSEDETAQQVTSAERRESKTDHSGQPGVSSSSVSSSSSSSGISMIGASPSPNQMIENPFRILVSVVTPQHTITGHDDTDGFTP
jgi:hypothetical protein